MSIIDFIKPDKVIMLDSSDTNGKFEFRPLERGFGLTVGNALRRVLLSSLEGFAISSFKVEGVGHEFSTIEGVVEDVTEIVLNLKRVRLKSKTEDAVGETINIQLSSDKEQFLAGDLSAALTSFEVLNPELVICNMEKNTNFSISIDIKKGRGYVSSDDNKIKNKPVGTIFIDSIFTPIKNVKYSVDNYRVGQKTDYEKLTLDIITDGSIIPKEALTESAKILIHHFMLFSDERITLEDIETSIVEKKDDDFLKMQKLLDTKLTDLDLSVRALNCLKNADVDTLGELVAYKKTDLIKFRNFGKKSLSELEDLVLAKNLNFGMNLNKYKNKI